MSLKRISAARSLGRATSVSRRTRLKALRISIQRMKRSRFVMIEGVIKTLNFSLLKLNWSQRVKMRRRTQLGSFRLLKDLREFITSQLNNCSRPPRSSSLPRTKQSPCSSPRPRTAFSSPENYKFLKAFSSSNDARRQSTYLVPFLRNPKKRKALA